MIRRRLHCLGDGALRANPFGEDSLSLGNYKTPCLPVTRSNISTLIGVDEHFQNSSRDTRLCRLMVRAMPNERVVFGTLSQWQFAKSSLHDRRLASLPDPRSGLIEIGSRPISAQESVI